MKKRTCLLLIFLLLCLTCLLQKQLVNQKNILLKNQNHQSIFASNFRGIFGDWLWLEFTILQNSKHYYQAYKYANLLNSLHMDSNETTIYLAWNAAYNISIKMTNNEEKWFWIQTAINLLKRKIMTSPDKSKIYWQLAWLYYHKIYWHSDLAHQFYKTKFSQEMSQFFNHNNHNWLKLNQSKKKVLEQKHFLKIINIQKLENKYGQLDWQLANTHALYWIEQAIQENSNKKNLKIYQETLQIIRFK